jgi:putative ABC transport system permease protein
MRYVKHNQTGELKSGRFRVDPRLILIPAPVNLAIDLRHAVRQWRAAPGFAVVSILSLALGIGSTATVFSVVYGALLDLYPYRGADRMVQLRLYDRSGRRNFLLLPARQFSDFRRLDVLDGAVAMDNWEMASTGDALPEGIRTAHLSADAFAYFGVPTILGRAFSDDSERVVVLGYPFWQRRYGGSRDVLGQTLELDHRNYTIIGVVPPRFRWGNSDVYTPLAMTSDLNRVYIVDARLKPGVSHQRAEAEMQPLLDQFARETPDRFPRGFRAHVASLTGAVVGPFKGTLLLMFAAVAVLLAVGCANVSILLLARGAGRLHEFAVRSALGASRNRLVGQLFTESALLAASGGALGVLLAVEGVKAVVDWLPKGTFPPEVDIHLNAPALVFSAAVAVIAGILSGISPALRFSAPRLNELMRGAGQRATAGSGSRRSHDFLTAAQVALTILLFSAAGSAMRSFLNVYRTKLGYDPHHVLTAGISIPDGSYTTYEARAAFYSRIHKRVAALPGVRAAAVALFPIPPMEDVRQPLEIFGRTAQKGQIVDVQQTTGEYFSTLGIPLLKGRVWSEVETDRAAPIAVINQEMARHFWPGGDPIGQRVRLPNFTAFTSWMLAAKGSNGWLEIVGVAGDTPNRGLREPVAPAMYVPYTLLMGDSMELVIRTESAPLTMVRAVREQIHSVDAGQPVSKTRTAEDLLRAEGWGREQFVASLFLVFAVLALALAATGLYSVTSYATALRAREFGIRMALGAQRSQVMRLALTSAVKTVGVGAAAGLTLSLAVKSFLARWIAGPVYDPVMLGAVIVTLLAASGLAARRAASCVLWNML